MEEAVVTSRVPPSGMRASIERTHKAKTYRDTQRAKEKVKVVYIPYSPGLLSY